VDHAPRRDLVGIAPGAQQGGGVLGEPEEEPDQHERDGQRHAVPRAAHGEVDPARPEHPERDRGERHPQVRQVVVGEEVGVEGDRGRRRPAGAIGAQTQVEPSPGLAEVRADRGVHEPREERHPGHGQRGVPGVAPRAVPHLEDLQRHAQRVERRDDQQFLRGLQPRGPASGGQQQAPDQQRVVPGDRRRDHLGQAQPGEDAEGEDAAQGLHPGEDPQLARQVPGGAGVDPGSGGGPGRPGPGVLAGAEQDGGRGHRSRKACRRAARLVRPWRFGEGRRAQPAGRGAASGMEAP